ncbi:MAG: hypothetical protein NZM43_07760 [Saprospiraceae bacterium]|nr:hypothetical protein [Saprospiraceae bacterium]MDW8484202.1 hypothetical protein [Saprospiraceae bacterium]
MVLSKTTCLVTSALLLTLGGMSQSTINTTFNLTPGYDGGWTILPVAAGGYVIFGNQYSSIGAKADAFCLRVDNEGKKVFHRSFGAPNTEETFGRGAVALADGWLVGGTRSVPPQGWLLRLNTDGQIVWEKTYTSITKINQLLPLPTGEYLAIGAGPLGGGMALARLSADGTIIWQRSYALPEPRDGYLTASGNACIVLSSDRISKIHLGTRDVVWSRKVSFPSLPPGAPEAATLTDIAPASKGLFAVIGSVYRELPTALYTAHYAAVWTESGELRWDRYFRGAARADYDENAGFGVTYLPNAQHILFTGKVGDNISITRTDLNGHLIDQKEIVTPGPVYAATLIRDGARYAMTGAVFVGSMATYFYRSNGNALSMHVNNSDLFAETPADRWELLHNPAQDRAWIVSNVHNVPREGIFRLWTLNGSLAREFRLWLTEGENLFPLDLSGLPEGLYWLAQVGEAAPPKALLLRR